MNREQAIALGKRLRAAYPAAVIEPETARLYLTELLGMDFELGQAAVYGCVETCRFLPSIAELRAAYDVEREKRRRFAEQERRREENEAFDQMERVPLRDIPDVVEALKDIEVRPDLPEEGIGGCSDCGTSGMLFRLGKVRVCAGCGWSRLRARERVA